MKELVNKIFLPMWISLFGRITDEVLTVAKVGTQRLSMKIKSHTHTGISLRGLIVYSIRQIIEIVRTIMLAFCVDLVLVSAESSSNILVRCIW